MDIFPVYQVRAIEKNGNAGASPMKIMILDRHILFRTGLLSLLRDQPNIEITQNEALEPYLMQQISGFEPKIIIMGGDLYEQGGREKIVEILALYPQIAILILAFRESPELMLDAIRNGARGYLPIDFSKSDLIKTLEAMARGEVAISRSMTTKVAKEFSRLTRVMHDSRLNPGALTILE